jgi:membrane-associated protease RseP (regulator of RpoE activity)
VVIVVAAKGLKLEKYGVEIKAYSLVYKNKQVQSVLTKILSRTRRGIQVFADTSVIAGFIMMGFAFWFLIDNVSKFFVAPTDFSELTVLIPGVTLTSASSITYFLLSIPIVLVVHEGAHGIVAALEKIKIKTGGFAIFIAMFAGFVEPDEEEFNKAKKISKLRVIGAGATANVIFAFVLGAVLLTNPLFALIMPEPLLSSFYELPEGVLILSIIEDSGAEQAGLLANDIITSINGIPISPEDPERGLIGIMRDNSLAYKPVLNFIQWNDMNVSMFLLWLWMISFFIGIINMLPLPILDGGKFLHTIIDQRLSEKSVNGIMWGIYGFTFALFGLNIALSYIKSGWFTI